MEPVLPSWVEEAAKLPVAFAQVREDPLIDEAVVRQLPDGARIIMIASGGCTLAYLFGMRGLPELTRIDVVDPNPAQIALARFKVLTLRSGDVRGRLAALGHDLCGNDTVAIRRGFLRIAEGGAIPEIAECIQTLGRGPVLSGLDYSGRYERVFAELRQALAEHAADVEALCQLRDPGEQSRRVHPDTALGQALDQAFDQVMDLPILVRLFGEGATRNRVEPFARHFARRTRHALDTLPAADNPYLWQVLLGRYPAGTPAPWFSRSDLAVRLPEITWHNTVMVEALRQSQGSYDFVHLSNILDWLSPAEASETLALAHAALRPGGWVLIRQLNSTLDVRAAGPFFEWHIEEADALHARDRSYFYRALHLGRKR